MLVHESSSSQTRRMHAMLVESTRQANTSFKSYTCSLLTSSITFTTALLTRSCIAAIAKGATDLNKRLSRTHHTVNNRCWRRQQREQAYRRIYEVSRRNMRFTCSKASRRHRRYFSLSRSPVGVAQRQRGRHNVVLVAFTVISALAQ